MPVITLEKVSVRQEGTHVLLIKNGHVVLDMPWEKAEELSKALRIKAMRAAEHAKYQQIIQDQALLFKTGAPFGITNHPALITEALKEAGAIRSKVVFGTPTVIGHPPRRKP